MYSASKKLLLALGLPLALSFNSAQAVEETVSLQTRDGVALNFRLLSSKNPVANVILFAGGKGKIGVKDWGIKKTGNFLVRSRELFLGKGLDVAVIDAPSDKKDEDGMFYGFRTSLEHVADVNAVIDYLRTRNNKPVWLVGTSRGTESVAHIAINTTKKIDGVVFTASITEKNGKGRAVTEMDLSKISVPVLISSHKKDHCDITPPRGAKKIKKKLTSSPRIEIKMYTGGNKPVSKPCKAKSQHGFYGIENEVVNDIVEFIKNS